MTDLHIKQLIDDLNSLDGRVTRITNIVTNIVQEQGNGSSLYRNRNSITDNIE